MYHAAAVAVAAAVAAAPVAAVAVAAAAVAVGRVKSETARHHQQRLSDGGATTAAAGCRAFHHATDERVPELTDLRHTITSLTRVGCLHRDI